MSARRAFSMLALMAVAASAGCLGQSGDPTPEAAPETEGAAGLTVSSPVRVLGTLTREPAIVQTPSRALFVAGYGTSLLVRPPAPAPPLFVPQFQEPPVLWSSRDRGATWARGDVGTVADGAIGNSDVDLAVAPDGTLYFASMSFSRIGHSIAVGASRDDGATWPWSLLSAQPLADRPFLAVGPDGAALVVWNDGRTVHHAASRDRGASWVEGPPVHAPGGAGLLAVGPRGELAVRIIPHSGSGSTCYDPANDGVAASLDQGETWSFRPLPGNRSWASPESLCEWPEPRWAESVAHDTAGTLYAAWGEGPALHLAWSRDGGARWDRSVLVRGEGDDAVLFPYLRAGDVPGVVAASWFTRSEANVTAHVALVQNADSRLPAVRVAAFPQDSGRNTGGEYFQVAWLAEGGVGAATTVQREDARGFEYRVVRGVA
ncbi:MAG: sialidase family protein [Methanobacteriota archaeon]